MILKTGATTSITPAPELETSTRVLKYSYVQNGTGQVNHVEQQYGAWFDPDAYLLTDYSYGPGGLVASVTTSDSGALAPRTESFGYSPDGVYVTQVVNAENHHLHWLFDPAHDGWRSAAGVG